MCFRFFSAFGFTAGRCQLYGAVTVIYLNNLVIKSRARVCHTFRDSVPRFRACNRNITYLNDIAYGIHSRSAYLINGSANYPLCFRVIYPYITGFYTRIKHRFKQRNNTRRIFLFGVKNTEKPVVCVSYLNSVFIFIYQRKPVTGITYNSFQMRTGVVCFRNIRHKHHINPTAVVLARQSDGIVQNGVFSVASGNMIT